MSEKQFLIVLGPILSKIVFWKKKLPNLPKNTENPRFVEFPKVTKWPELADNYSKTSALSQSLSKIFFVSQTQKFMHFMSISLKSHVNSLGGEKGPSPPLEFFWEVFLFKMGPPKFFCMFSSKFVVLKKILGFSTFVVAEIFWVKSWKILKFWPFPKTLFFTTKIKKKKKTILVVKNRVLGKGQNFKIFQFLTQMGKIKIELKKRVFIRF